MITEQLFIIYYAKRWNNHTIKQHTNRLQTVDYKAS